MHTHMGQMHRHMHILQGRFHPRLNELPRRNKHNNSLPVRPTQTLCILYPLDGPAKVGFGAICIIMTKGRKGGYPNFLRAETINSSGVRVQKGSTVKPLLKIRCGKTKNWKDNYNIYILYLLQYFERIKVPKIHYSVSGA